MKKKGQPNYKKLEGTIYDKDSGYKEGSKADKARDKKEIAKAKKKKK